MRLEIMRIGSTNLLAILFLCTFIYVFCVWFGTEFTLGGPYTPMIPVPEEAFSLRSRSSDISPKTLRALLALSASQILHFGKMINIRNRSATAEQNNNLRIFKNKESERDNGTSARTAPNEIDGLLQDGIFWSDQLESLLPSAFTEDHARAWRERVRGNQVVSLTPGCGRLSNRLAFFADGTKACVRYGINVDQVQGETLSYYLASLLGITNLPPLAVSQVNPAKEQWVAVKDAIGTLQWTAEAIVSLTEWISNLTGVIIPVPLRQEGEGLRPLQEDLGNRTIGELLELMEWTDLILYDFLTANFDRLVSNLFSLQWDPRVMERDISNLHKMPTGQLVFIDNEAGLVHGFRVLHMWEKYHDRVLASVCVFRKKTAQRVMELHQLNNVRERLLDLFKENEPLAPELGFLSDECAMTLQKRINVLYKHIQNCKEKYTVQ